MRVLPCGAASISLSVMNDSGSDGYSPVRGRSISFRRVRVIKHAGLHGKESATSASRAMCRETCLSGNSIRVVGLVPLEPKPFLLEGCPKRWDCVH
jgi:hypothetical protein